MNPLQWLALLLVIAISACHHGTPGQPGQYRAPDLVDVAKLDPTIRLDIRYATSNNFVGSPVYTQARSLLQRPAAEALIRANRTLRARGYGVVVFDAYRPWSVTKLFWDAATEADRKNNFVADPRQGSKHNRGCAVDLSLFDLETGLEVEMPSAFDEFSERAHHSYKGGTVASRRLRDVLRQTIEAQGFESLDEKWWHYNYRDWPKYRLLDIPFESVAPRNPSRSK